MKYYETLNDFKKNKKRTVFRKSGIWIYPKFLLNCRYKNQQNK
ncbi:MAG: hypothetical protein JWQ34_2579 [Mucilaginibacter sp.]|nr:hypothetical protein [Mucilaginibacter sp.]